MHQVHRLFLVANAALMLMSCGPDSGRPPEVPAALVRPFALLDSVLPAAQRESLRVVPPDSAFQLYLSVAMHLPVRLELKLREPGGELLEARGFEGPSEMLVVALKAYRFYLRKEAINLDSIITTRTRAPRAEDFVELFPPARAVPASRQRLAKRIGCYRLAVDTNGRPEEVKFFRDLPAWFRLESTRTPRRDLIGTWRRVALPRVGWDSLRAWWAPLTDRSLKVDWGDGFWSFELRLKESDDTLHGTVTYEADDPDSTHRASVRAWRGECAAHSIPGGSARD